MNINLQDRLIKIKQWQTQCQELLCETKFKHSASKVQILIGEYFGPNIGWLHGCVKSLRNFNRAGMKLQKYTSLEILKLSDLLTSRQTRSKNKISVSYSLTDLIHLVSYTYVTVWE